MVLYLIGLGLGDERDITLRGLDAIKSCSAVYLEHYTSILGVDREKLEALYGCKVGGRVGGRRKSRGRIRARYSVGARFRLSVVMRARARARAKAAVSALHAHKDPQNHTTHTQV